MIYWKKATYPITNPTGVVEAMRKHIGLIVVLWLSTLACSLLSPSSPTPVGLVATNEVPTASPVDHRPTATLLAQSSTPHPSPSPTEFSPICVPQKVHQPIAPVDYDIISQAVLDFLNDGATADELNQALNELHIANQPISAISADMTGDKRIDVVVSVYNPNSQNVPSSGSLLIYVCQGGQYKLAFNLPNPGDAIGPIIWFLEDIDGDGRADLVDSLATCGAHTCYEEVRIISWENGSFVNRLEGNTSDLPYPLVEIRDSDGDGVYDLEVTGTGIASVGAGPQRSLTRVWKYDPILQRWQKSEEILGESDYRVHKVHDADIAASEGDFERALILYQRAISDPDLYDWVEPDTEKANLTAYSQFKMIVVYSILGQGDFAQIVYQELADSYSNGDPQYAFVEMANVFLQAFAQEGIDNGCTAVTDFAGAHANEILVPLTSFGYGNPGYIAEDICPFE